MTFFILSYLIFSCEKVNEEYKSSIRYSVYVENLPDVVQEEDLKEIFQGFKIIDHSIKKDQQNKTATSFVYLESEEDVKNAIVNVTDTEVEGKVIRVFPVFELRLSKLFKASHKKLSEFYASSNPIRINLHFNKRVAFISFKSKDDFKKALELKDLQANLGKDAVVTPLNELKN